MRGWKDGAGNLIEDWKAALDYWATFEGGRREGGRKGSGPARKGKKKAYGHFVEREVSGDELDDLERALLERG